MYSLDAVCVYAPSVEGNGVDISFDPMYLAQFYQVLVWTPARKFSWIKWSHLDSLQNHKPDEVQLWRTLVAPLFTVRCDVGTLVAGRCWPENFLLCSVLCKMYRTIAEIKQGPPNSMSETANRSYTSAFPSSGVQWWEVSQQPPGIDSKQIIYILKDR